MRLNRRAAAVFLLISLVLLSSCGAEKANDPDAPTHLCTLSIRCDTAVKNSALMEDKLSLLPPDGIFFSGKEAAFQPGETAFDLLLRECRENGIHMEFKTAPLYDAKYIEGIGNLYEFDCGELSGWMFRINGKFSDYSSSSVVLSDGDHVEWVYTCDLGLDVGSDFSSRQSAA